MKRTDAFDIKRSNLLQNSLYVLAELAHDSKIIAASFASPAFRIFDIVCSKLAKGICGKQHFVLRIVGKHDFGPMHIGSADITKRATAKIKLIAFLAHNLAIREIGAEISSHHLEGHLRSHNVRVRITIHESNDARRMVGLHMMHYKVIRRTTRKRSFNIT